MSRTLAFLAAAMLASAPQVSLGAAPVEVTYSDAVSCAAVDTALAIALTSDEGKTSAEDQKTADYLSGMADKWLAQASAANPGGEEATMNDIVQQSTALFLSLADDTDKAGKEKMANDLAKCSQLEEAAYGGPNGLVD